MHIQAQAGDFIPDQVAVRTRGLEEASTQAQAAGGTQVRAVVYIQGQAAASTRVQAVVFTRGQAVAFTQGLGGGCTRALKVACTQDLGVPAIDRIYPRGSFS